MTTSEVCTRYIESDNPAGEIVWMARQSGCKPSEIIYVLNCCGLETPINIPDEGEVLDRGRDKERSPCVFTPDLDAKIMELRNSGLLPSKISEQVGIDARRISHRLHILKRRKEAVDRNFNSKDGERQADFINIVAWRQTAEFIVRYFVKGQMIALEGSIQTRSYEDKNGNKRMAVEVIAEHVWFAGGKSDNGASARPSNPCADTTDFLEISSDSDDLPF